MSKVLNKQIVFRNSAQGMRTAVFLIHQKLSRSNELLGRYDRSARRRYVSHAAIIRQARVAILREIDKVDKADTREAIFLAEARAARHYWKAVAIICHNPDWLRVQRHPNDELNKTLNIGYHWLAGYLEKEVKNAGLYPDIGILHSNNLVAPLVYDCMEPLRAHIDSCIIPLFSKKKILDETKMAKTVVALCAKSLDAKIIISQIRKIKSCIMHNKAYSERKNIKKLPVAAV